MAERAELAVVDVERYLQWLEHSLRAALQVIGPSGHGKSTHLRALQAAWFARQPSAASGELPALVYFPEEGDQPALPRSRPLFVDEAQRMRWWRRRQLLGGSGPLVLGTHRDMTRQLQSAGFQVLTVDLDQPMPPARLQEVLNRRIAASSVEPMGPNIHDHALFLTIQQVVALQDRFGSNIRRIEDYLYEQFQAYALKREVVVLQDGLGSNTG